MKEFVLPVLRRFEWLAERRAEIEPIEIKEQIYRLDPVSPLSNARDQEDAAQAVQFVLGINQMFPQMAGLMIDGLATVQAIKDLQGVDAVKLQDPEKASQMLADLMAQSQSGTRVNSRGPEN
jgi:hypothetical protein